MLLLMPRYMLMYIPPHSCDAFPPVVRMPLAFDKANAANDKLYMLAM
jgi:hypothetical protein